MEALLYMTSIILFVVGISLIAVKIGEWNSNRPRKK